MITRRGGALLLAAVLLWAVGRFVAAVELNVLAVTALAIVAAGLVAVRLASASVSVRRSVSSPRVLHGGEAEVLLELRNDQRLPAGLLLVEDTVHYTLGAEPRFVVPGLGPNRTVALRYVLTGGARGRYQVGPARIRVRDPFGVAERTRTYRSTEEILVYPEVEPLTSAPARGRHEGAGTSAARRIFRSGDEFHTMREYVIGDDLRLVHWPSTARRQTLMIRQQEQPWEARATVFCDTRRSAHAGSAAFEKAVSIASSLVWHLADADYQLRLVTEADTRTPATAPWQVLLDRLAEVEPSPVPALAPALLALRSAGGEGLLVAVVAPPVAPRGDAPLSASPDVRALLQTGRGYAERVAFVVDASGDAPGSRGTQLAALLTSAGWRAVAIGPGQALASRWDDVATRRGRGHAVAFDPQRVAGGAR